MQIMNVLQDIDIKTINDTTRHQFNLVTPIVNPNRPILIKSEIVLTLPNLLLIMKVIQKPIIFSTTWSTDTLNKVYLYLMLNNVS